MLLPDYSPERRWSDEIRMQRQAASNIPAPRRKSYYYVMRSKTAVTWKARPKRRQHDNRCRMQLVGRPPMGTPLISQHANKVEDLGSGFELKIRRPGAAYRNRCRIQVAGCPPMGASLAVCVFLGDLIVSYILQEDHCVYGCSAGRFG